MIQQGLATPVPATQPWTSYQVMADPSTIQANAYRLVPTEIVTQGAPPGAVISMVPPTFMMPTYYYPALDKSMPDLVQQQVLREALINQHLLQSLSMPLGARAAYWESLGRQIGSDGSMAFGGPPIALPKAISRRDEESMATKCQELIDLDCAPVMQQSCGGQDPLSLSSNDTTASSSTAESDSKATKVAVSSPRQVVTTTDSPEIPQPTRPKRALTAYNIFFQEQREFMYQERLAKAQQLVQHETGKARSRALKAHVKISFEELARAIAKKWKSLSPEEMAVYTKHAADDKKRYEAQHTNFMKHECIKREQMRAKLEESVPEETKRVYFAGKEFAR